MCWRTHRGKLLGCHHVLVSHANPNILAVIMSQYFLYDTLLCETCSNVGSDEPPVRDEPPLIERSAGKLGAALESPPAIRELKTNNFLGKDISE